MITKQQYKSARKQLEQAQNESVKASRSGDQAALDKASDKAVAALAIIAAYKNQK